MKNIINLVMTILLATQFNLAKAAEMDTLAQATELIDEVSSMSNPLYQKKSKKMIALVDQAILKVENLKDNSEVFQKKLDKAMDDLFEGRKKKTKKLLGHDKKMKRLYSKVTNQALTYKEFKLDLENSIHPDSEAELKKNVFMKIKGKDDAVAFLQEFRLELVEDSKVVFKNKLPNETGRMPASYSASAWIITILYVALLIVSGMTTVAVAVALFTVLNWVWVILGVVALFVFVSGIVAITHDNDSIIKARRSKVR